MRDGSTGGCGSFSRRAVWAQTGWLFGTQLGVCVPIFKYSLVDDPDEGHGYIMGVCTIPQDDLWKEMTLRPTL